MRTVGIDLAAEDANTAVATIDWSTGAAVVSSILLPADDETILETCESADKIGIDCPLGWPEPFLAMLNEHRLGVIGIPKQHGKDWRRTLAQRRTDEFVRTLHQITPLSVSCDRIGHVAFRCAELQREFAERGKLIDRSGATGRLVEAYPAAALKAWKLPHKGYKGKQHVEARHQLAKALDEETRWLDFGSHLELCQEKDHALDAVITALIARAAAIDKVHRPPVDRDRELAAIEGWIAVPNCELDDLPRQT